MRFDDRLATVLAQPANSAPARQALWRQLVDLLAQPGTDDLSVRNEALQRLVAWRAEVPAAVRQSMAIQLLSRRLPLDVLIFFSEDMAAVSAPLIGAVQMAGTDWEEVIPRLSPVARSLLRHRTDLPAEALRSLKLFGASDLMIEAAPIAEVPTLFAEEPVRASAPRQFSFETDSLGAIRWSDLPQRGALIGLTLAHPAQPGGPGVDGQAAGAFRGRAAFRDARLLIGGSGEASGAWLITGIPHFDAATGRFQGYRGNGQRLRADDPDTPMIVSAATRDSLRQLSHELRTPLNAISGFAEMIDQQLLGPVQPPYRSRAAAILSDTRRIEAVLNDLDDVSEYRAEEPSPTVTIDCGLLLAQLIAEQRRAATERGVLVGLMVEHSASAALARPGPLERAIRRLLGTAIGLAAQGERIEVSARPVASGTGEIVVAISRPMLLSDFDDDRMFAACEVDGEDVDAAPPLGLGFSLRLIRNLVEQAGATLAVGADLFEVRLTAAPESVDELGGEDPRTVIVRNLAE